MSSPTLFSDLFLSGRDAGISPPFWLVRLPQVREARSGRHDHSRATNEKTTGFHPYGVGFDLAPRGARAGLCCTTTQRLGLCQLRRARCIEHGEKDFTLEGSGVWCSVSDRPGWWSRMRRETSHFEPVNGESISQMTAPVKGTKVPRTCLQSVGTSSAMPRRQVSSLHTRDGVQNEVSIGSRCYSGGPPVGKSKRSNTS